MVIGVRGGVCSAVGIRGVSGVRGERGETDMEGVAGNMGLTCTMAVIGVGADLGEGGTGDDGIAVVGVTSLAGDRGRGESSPNAGEVGCARVFGFIFP